MKLSTDAVKEIAAVARLAESAISLCETWASLIDHGGSMQAAQRLAIGALVETIWPVSTLVIMQRDGDTVPLLWCPDEGWAREYLEHAARPGLLRVWRVSREEPAPVDITDVFCHSWMCDVAHRDEAEDDFLRRLPEFIQEHYGDEALSLYRQPKDGE